MKSLLLLFCLISFGVFSQKPPEQGDYVSRARVADVGGHYIFKKSRMVYFDFNDSLSYHWDNAYKQDAKRINSYFKKLDKAKLASMKSVDEKTINQAHLFDYAVMEFKKNGILIRICWDTTGTDKNTILLNELNSSLDGFW